MVDHGNGLVTLNSGDTLHLRWLVRLMPMAQGTKCMAILLEQDCDGGSAGLRLTKEEGDQLRAAWLAWARGEAPPVAPLPLPVAPPATPLDDWLATPAASCEVVLWQALARELMRRGWTVEIGDWTPAGLRSVEGLPPLRWERGAREAGQGWRGWYAHVGASSDGFLLATAYPPPSAESRPICPSTIGEMVQLTLGAMINDERAATAQEVQDG